jgi:rare lipoprotein A
MRKLLMAVATLVSTGLIFSTGASAAARWNCDGPEYVCGSTASARATRNDDASESKPARAKSAKTRAVQETASYEPEDKPVRNRKSRSVSSENSGSGASYSGQASYYWQPQALASGGRLNPNALTAAHKTLPFGTRVLVTNQRNGQSVEVVINDRGPYVGGRIIDLSKAAAQAINMTGAGVAPVNVKVLGRG